MHTTPSEIIATQIRKRRRQLDLNRQQLAETCAEVGAPQLTVAALTNIETGRPDKEGRRRREVTVDELLALAVALKMHPVDLMVASDAADEESYSITAKEVTTAGVARDWIGGLDFLERPETPLDFAQAIQSMPKERARAVSRKWFTPERQREWNRQTLEWERREAERWAQDPAAKDEHGEGRP